MSYKSAQELLKTELSGYQKHGTSVTEGGLTVSVEPFSSERVLFFHTDLKEVRELLDMPPRNNKICDYLVLYVTNKDDYQKEIICFLELKGKNFDHAVEQVCNTYIFVKGMIEAEVSKERQISIVCSACICMHGNAPRDGYTSRGKRKLEQTFGHGRFRIKHSGRHDHEFGQFLRNLYLK